ncbi:tRNA (pseudouridine(54)-N(1))-methyltransferase TrmY [Candidatus Pacearchaeota archaeon]|nr:tRNA (pseudouridine(54)-N(1))-methyltransferase TrmY [Candidatus Pacearchaeota archaeon]
MREFVYFSNKAVTSGKYLSGNLMHAGRMDIAIHVLINSLFLSHKIREKTKIHLIFNGPPNPPQHLIIFPDGKKSSGKIQLSKKDVAGLIKKMLYKSNPNKITKVEEGYEIEKKSVFKVLDEMEKDGKEIYILDSKGEDLRKVRFSENSVLVIGDHEGFNKKEFKKLKSYGETVSIGSETYFASQVVTIINNELDRQGI